MCLWSESQRVELCYVLNLCSNDLMVTLVTFCGDPYLYFGTKLIDVYNKFEVKQ